VSLVSSLKETIQEAWITLSRLPDPDARFRRGLGFGWILPTINDARDAYGSAPASENAKASPEKISEAEVVFEWLAWLRREEPPEGGEYAIKRIGAWALGTPIWRMAQSERCSEKTIHNRIDRSVAKIVATFVADQDDQVEVAAIYEPQPKPILTFTPPPGRIMAGPLEDAGKVFIAGIGMMFRGKRYRSALDGDISCGKRRR
jgi:hypothetical protein